MKQRSEYLFQNGHLHQLLTIKTLAQMRCIYLLLIAVLIDWRERFTSVLIDWRE